MNKRIAIAATLFLSTPILVGCREEKKNEVNNELRINEAGEVTTVLIPSIDTNVKEGQEVSIIPEKWKEFYEDYKKNGDYLRISNFYTVNVEDTKAVSLPLSWTNNMEGSQYYVLYLSTSYSMNDPQTFFTMESLYNLEDLYAGTHYFYQIHAYYEDHLTISRIFDFKTIDFVRALDIEGLQNARDLGNKHSADGSKKIRQGLAYRSGELSKITKNGKRKALYEYGFKTDLDLREKQNPAASPLGINYVSNATEGTDGSPYYAGKGESGPGLDSSKYQPACRDNLKVFANRNNYPIIFHCAVGRDRTGTLAILLELLLKINLEEIKIDYMFHVFSSLTNSFPFEQTVTSMNTIFDYLSKYVAKDGTNTGDIYERTERYCLDIGVTNEEIANIRSILLEEVKA